MNNPIPPAPSIYARLPFYYGWVNVPLAAIAMVTTLAGNDQGLGLITESLLKDVGINRIAWSNINFCATLIGSLFLFPTGRLIDRFGARGVFTAILFPLGATVILMSRASTVAELWATAILTSALGQSALSVASMTLVGKWFSRRISMAMGVYAILVVIGYIVAFLLLGPAITRSGWRLPWRALGYVILCGIAPLSALLVRSTPESVGLAGDRRDDADTPETGMPWEAATRTGAFWLFGLSSAFYGMLINGIMLFYESILHERGFGASTRDTVLAVSTFAGLLASFAGGWLGMRWSLAKLLAVAMALQAAALILLAHVSSFNAVIIHAVLMGSAGALVTVIFFAVWSHAFGRAHLGKIQGIAQGLCIIPGGFGPRLLAEIQHQTGSYVPAFYAAAGVSAAFCIWACRVRMPASDSY